MNKFHTPVMLKEAVDFLNVKKDCWYVDCNLGGGGHTRAILKAGGRVIGVDLDQEAISEVESNNQSSITNNQLILVQGNFVNLDEIVKNVIPDQIGNPIAGILFDLGPSSHQLDTAERGFSFMNDAPLDMRMDPSAGAATAADLVNGLHEKELSELFWKLGEEQWAKLIAKKIVEERKIEPIRTTIQLAKIIERVKRREGHIHPATKVFQALRIAVNDELNNLKEVLPKAFEVLHPGGRLVVISFHSLEDRIVKEFAREVGDSGAGIEITKKPIEANETEVSINPRARSAKLRVIEKTSI